MFLWALATLVPSRERAEIRNEVREVGGFPGIITYSDVFFLFPFQCVVPKTKMVCICVCLGMAHALSSSLLPLLQPQ